MVERLYQELENGMTDDEKSDLRKNLIDLDKQRKFFTRSPKESYLKKINKVQLFRSPNYTKNVPIKIQKYDEMSNRWMNRDVGGKRQCVVVKNFNQTLVDSLVYSEV